jgi:hypothetical protein
MFAIPLITGLTYLSYEFYNYYNYKKTIDYSQKKVEDYDIEDLDKKSEWMIKYLLDLEKPDLLDWVVSNIRSKTKSQVEMINLNKTMVIKCLCFNIYYKAFKNLTEHQQITITNLYSHIETKLEHQFKIDNCGTLEYYKFGRNELEVVYKPAVFYSLMNIIKNYTYYQLKSNGFIQSKKGNITYFYKCSKPDNPETTMFIHGLGFGSTPYLNFILNLSKETNLIVPILPNISNMEYIGFLDDINADSLFPSCESLRTDFRAICTECKVEKLNIVAHSFGTIITFIIMKDAEIFKIINKKVLIDPVCFIEKCHKIFKYMDQPDDKGIYLNKVFNAIVYNDVYVRYATQRFLLGPKYWLYGDYSVLENSVIILSSLDKIVPSYSIYESLGKFGIASILVEDAEHGDIFRAMYFGVQEYIVSFVS